MKRYLKLYASFVRAGFIADLEYRANFVSRVVTDIFWYLAQIIGFEVIFDHAPQISDWNRSKTRIFLGLMFITDALFMIAFSENMDKFSQKIRNGELDLILVKPIESQFMVSLQKVSTSLIANLIIACSIFLYSFLTWPEASFIRLFWLIVLIPCGTINLYAFRFFFAATSVIFTRAENLNFLFYQLYRLGLRPDSIYNRWLRLVILTVIPVAFVGSVPARFLVEEPDFALFAWTLFWTGSVLYLSHRYWNFALKSYTSASS